MRRKLNSCTKMPPQRGCWTGFMTVRNWPTGARCSGWQRPLRDKPDLRFTSIGPSSLLLWEMAGDGLPFEALGHTSYLLKGSSDRQSVVIHPPACPSIQIVHDLHRRFESIRRCSSDVYIPHERSEIRIAETDLFLHSEHRDSDGRS